VSAWPTRTMIIKPIKTRIFEEKENLLSFVTSYFKKIPEKSVVVITSKIVALSEGRTAEIENEKTKEELIRRESDLALRTEHVWLTIKDGVVMASAGIDESNADGKLILLPRNSFKTAVDLRKKLQKKYKVKNLGVLIVDSRTMPLRAGVVGSALGYAGFRGIKEYAGSRDLFGRKFKFSRTNVADGLATGAVLTMGEGRERQPLVLITGAPIKFSDRISRAELKIDIKNDMYRPLFVRFCKTKP